MKKSVVFIIAVIYILSIVFVGYQVQFRLARPTVYVDTITCINDDVTILSYDEGVSSGHISSDIECDGVVCIGYDTKVTYPYSFELKFDASPDNANTRSVSYIYDTSLTYVSIEKSGDLSCNVNYTKAGKFLLTVTADDRNGGATLSLYIDAKRSGIL